MPKPHKLELYESSLTQGKGHSLPALFYFALSGEDSLNLAPYNQPVVFLADAPIRIFSFTIPGHGPGLDNNQVMAYWAKELSEGRNFLEKFILSCRQRIEDLVSEGIVDPQKMAAAGLSRGAFIAAHLTAREPRIKYLLGYAPLTDLEVLDEFQTLSKPLTKQLSLKNLCAQLMDRHVRFYIGNRDVRVDTTACFEFIRDLADTAYGHRIRIPQAELVIRPSIGHKGHGTSRETFREGADWLRSKMLS